MSPAVEIAGLWKRFRIYSDRNTSLKASILQRFRARYSEFWALEDINFDIAEGETLGIIGANGSGKSTLLKCISRLLTPDRGHVAVRGTVSAMLELGTGFHPDLSGRENVYLSGSILGLKRRDIDQRFDDIVAFSGLSRFIDSPVRNYSSGMYMRLGFAVSVNVEPDILLIDEVLSVGDEAFQRSCIAKLEELRSEGRTIVAVSHSLPMLAHLCDRIAWLDNGNLSRLGEPDPTINAYQAESTVDGGVLRRWGSGEIIVTHAELLDASGQTTGHCRTGDPVIFRLHYTSKVPLDETHVCLTIQRSDGLIITGPTTRETGFQTGRLSGSGWIDMMVERLPLLHGSFEIAASLRDQDLVHIYDHVQHLLRFEVLPGQSAEPSGLLTFWPVWSVTPVHD